MENITKSAVEKKYRGYIRPEPRFPAAKQREVLEALSKFSIYEEAAKQPDGFPMRAGMIKALRSGDIVVVSDLHRLAPDGESLRPILKDIREKNVALFEASTGRTSQTPGDMDNMILDAFVYYRSKGLTPAQARRLGVLGAAASPATKKLEGRMPKFDAQGIWCNREYTVEEALAAINLDERYPTKYSMATAYRELGRRNVLPGRRPKGYAQSVRVERKKARLRKGAVYFLRANGRGPVKIGFTTDIDHRMATLSTGHHQELKLVGVIEGTRTDEKALHRRFEMYHVKGEWFKVEGTLKKYLATLPKLEEA